MKRVFVDQIKTIFWRNKIATTTMNLAEGEFVTEIEILEVRLSTPFFDDVSVLKQIDKEIPYHIVFLLEYESRYQAWAAYKETSISGKSSFMVGAYYHTDWLPECELPLKIEGLTMDSVYENFVRQIAGEVLQADKNESLKESVERDARRQELQKSIAALQVKVGRERQLNKQVILNAELKRLKNELEGLISHE